MCGPVGSVSTVSLDDRRLETMRDALDKAHESRPRLHPDDDAGWDDERLIGLLDLLAGLGLPVDLAAIPASRAGSPASCASGSTPPASA